MVKANGPPRASTRGWRWTRLKGRTQVSEGVSGPQGPLTLDPSDTMNQRLAEGGGTRQSGHLLEAHRLAKHFGASLALQEASISVDKGDRICIVGPNGSGKTTLLRCLNLLVEPSSGELYFHGDLVGRWPSVASGRMTDERAYRKRIGMVFQHFELFPHLTALDNVALGPRRVLHRSKVQAREQARDLLRRVGLEAFAESRPRELSGGQKQRVAIARALAMQPDIVLFDEPTSALDAEMVREVLDLMTSLATAGLSMVIVTHELRFARRVANRIVVMDKGLIIEEGATQSVFNTPARDRTREILSTFEGEDRG